jgi:hypothetical protein
MLKSSGMFFRVDWLIVTDVSEARIFTFLGSSSTLLELLDPEDEDTAAHRNVGNNVQVDIAKNPRKLQ